MAANERRRALIIIPIVLLLALAAWWGYATWRAAQVTETGALAASGTAEANESQVASVLSARILTVEATEGVDVKAGDELFRLDDKLLRLQVDQAEAGLRAARAALKQAKDDDKSKAEIAAAQAKVDQASAAVDMAKTQAGYAKVTAPVAGVLTAVSAHAGENASPGKTLATIADLSKLHVSVYIPETQIGRVTIGDRATVSADGAPKSYSGRVTFISSEAEFTPNNIETRDQRTKLVYEVRVSIEGGTDYLKPGMPVDVTVEGR